MYSTCGQLCHLYGGGDDDREMMMMIFIAINLLRSLSGWCRGPTPKWWTTLTTWDLLLLTMYYNEIYNVSTLVTLMSRSSLNYPTSVGVGGSIILILLARKYMKCGSWHVTAGTLRHSTRSPLVCCHQSDLIPAVKIFHPFSFSPGRSCSMPE